MSTQRTNGELKLGQLRNSQEMLTKKQEWLAETGRSLISQKVIINPFKLRLLFEKTVFFSNFYSIYYLHQFLSPNSNNISFLEITYDLKSDYAFRFETDAFLGV